ncbi:MAG TPA: M13 family metallopeptidase [Rudaea sp.]|jgi:putative endopeptidase|nr:M13 family metallopeptidase [Rudaea sp.]
MKPLPILTRSALVVAVALAVVLSGCNRAPNETAPVAATPAAKPAAKPDVVAANIDTSVNPGDDFFQFANGAWLKSNPIPPSEASWGIGFVVRDDLYDKLRKISEDAAKSPGTAGSDEQKIGDYWAAAVDEQLADQQGITPLKNYLDRIDAANDMQGVLDAAFDLRRLNVDVFYDFEVSQDERASDVMALHLDQGGLGLPDRDYYFKDEEGIVKVRAAYVAHLQHVFKLLGADDAAAANSAKQVMAFETALAKVSRELADRRDPIKNYNKMAPADLTQKYTPSIDWTKRFGGWDLSPSYVIVGQPEFFGGLEAQLKQTPVPVLRDYLRVHLVDRFAPFLDKNFDAENFDFYGRTLTGQKEQKPRWKRALDSENRAIGMILGRLFVKEYFSEAAKKRYNDLVEAVRTAYGERIDHLDWMSAATKAKAHEKLAAVTKKVGYPDKWKDYSTLTIARNSYAENALAASRWRFDDRLSKFGKPVDRTEWGMTPQTYNAYYNPSNNEIVLPAAQFAIPGFTDAELDDAIVYGYAAASTIGHEMTHGFDDEGRQFDASGNLTDWWTKDDAEKFQKRADVMVKQFDAYEPLPGLHVNGRAALGENIADYGGLLIGLDAFKKTDQYKKGEKIAGYTPLQRFFLGYALSWLFETNDAMLRRSLLSDVHAPPKWRTNGPLSNMPDFWTAFDVKPGQAMRRADADRVDIW